MDPEQVDQRFPVLQNTEAYEAGKIAATLAIELGEVTEKLSRVERVPRYADGRRENDAEHSYMLTIVAPEIAHALDLDLDLDNVRRFALVHDLIEIKIGDISTFNLSQAELDEKERLEKVAKKELYNELPFLTSKDLQEYDLQDTPEAIFVRTVDKLLPIVVDINGDGVRIMREDYGVNSLEQLEQSHTALHSRIDEKFGNDFPTVVAAHAVLCKLFEVKYQKAVAETSIAERPRNPTEIELKYVVDLNDLPENIDLNTLKTKHLRQGYVAIGRDGSETRIRSTDDKRFEFTTKSPGMIARDEQTMTLTREIFEGMWPQTTGRQVVKTRYHIPYNEVLIELDVYEGDLEGLVTAEVEFDGRPGEAMLRASTFEPPEWFGKNVSEDSRYKNHNLTKGMPHDPVPLGARTY